MQSSLSGGKRVAPATVTRRRKREGSWALWGQFWQTRHCCLTDRRRRWHPTPVLLPGKSHGWRCLVGCHPRGQEKSDTTERLHFHFSLSCIGGGNGNPLQCSCLENPRDRGAWWAAIYGSHRVGHDWSDLAAVAAAWQVKTGDTASFLKSVSNLQNKSYSFYQVK